MGDHGQRAPVAQVEQIGGGEVGAHGVDGVALGGAVLPPVVFDDGGRRPGDEFGVTEMVTVNGATLSVLSPNAMRQPRGPPPGC
ncbi:uncharacterized protein RMCC_1006 [Mycolicibacterium canariasense]|uniref:Uncharacterized protein n=1 Tax=Mycolicibacterium canariasense TaxID=228230 RepID=A0A124E1L3_MYCCR|nr:uncharacterized protein RMCC_1006 [Mycolicibacterium canariasense]